MSWNLIKNNLPLVTYHSVSVWLSDAEWCMRCVSVLASTGQQSWIDNQFTALDAAHYIRVGLLVGVAVSSSFK